MSANPAAFDFLRSRAYAWVAANGRDESSLTAYLERELGAFRTEPDGKELTDVEAEALVAAVSRWTVDHYQPRRTARTSGRTWLHRGLDAAFVVTLAETLAEQPSQGRARAASVRSIARLAGKSPSAVGRILKEHRHRQNRDALVASLRPTAQAVLEVVEAMLGAKHEGVVHHADVAAVVWIDADEPERTTRLMRMSRVAEALEDIRSAGVLAVYTDRKTRRSVVRRGPVWQSTDEVDAVLNGPESALVLPRSEDVPAARFGPLWGSRVGQTALAILAVGADRATWRQWTHFVFATCNPPNPRALFLILIRFVHRSVEDLPADLRGAMHWPRVDENLARSLEHLAAAIQITAQSYLARWPGPILQTVYDRTLWHHQLSHHPREREQFADVLARVSAYSDLDEFYTKLRADIATHTRGRRPKGSARA